VLAPGLTRWLEVAHLIERWGRLAAPHHYGTHLGNYVGAHIGLAVPRFAFAEWDEVTTPGIAAPGYAVVDGYAEVPVSPGFGLELDEDAFGRAVREGGVSVSARAAPATRPHQGGDNRDRHARAADRAGLRRRDPSTPGARAARPAGADPDPAPGRPAPRPRARHRAATDQAR
jgi:hypothetical protein